MTAIRPAGPADLGALARMVLDFGAEFDDRPEPGVQERLAAAVDDPRTTFLLTGRPPVGFIALRLRDVYWSARPEVVVEDLYVMPAPAAAGTGAGCCRPRSPPRASRARATSSSPRPRRTSRPRLSTARTGCGRPSTTTRARGG